MQSLDLDALEYVLKKFDDGNLFEKFAHDLISSIVGIDFVPVGGIHDRGIDGLEHAFLQNGTETTIYQISIQKTYKQKINKTIKDLQSNKVTCDRLFYVTNQIVEGKDTLVEELYQEYGTNVVIRDLKWLKSNIAASDAATTVYLRFVDEHMHSFHAPGETFELHDFTGDPRVFVFLRQQFNDRGDNQNLGESLIDGLIIFALENTDPDQNIFLTRDEIYKNISEIGGFHSEHLDRSLDKRLRVLSSKPRRINFHNNEQAFCLPYETRLKIKQQLINDASLYEAFNNEVESRLGKHLEKHNAVSSNPLYLLQRSLNMIFQRQGLDFSNFILQDTSSDTGSEIVLEDVISNVITQAGVSEVNRPNLQLALHGCLRELIYRGTEIEIEFLQRLSKTYLMLFCIQCEPKVCSYFDTLASSLKIFVDNSILVPTLSEICIEDKNRRYWNLLTQAKNAGIKLLVNDAILEELVSHIQMVIRIYDEDFKGREHHYEDEITLRYIDKIILRAYFYERTRDNTFTFDKFINKFVSPRVDKPAMCHEIRTFLAHEFGIEFVNERSLEIDINKEEYDELHGKLCELKPSEHQARIDANTALIIYGLRERDCEGGQTGVFSYKTWWLSTDTTTHLAVQASSRSKHRTSCYLRPDFLLNYIVLSSTRQQATSTFEEMFPTLVGIGISHHVDNSVSSAVNTAISEHSEHSPSRIKAIVGSMSADLMTKKLKPRSRDLKTYLEEKFGR